MSLLNECRETFQTHWRILRERWVGLRELWNDPVQKEFEREFWQEFEQVVPAALREMRKLDDVIAQARREVR